MTERIIALAASLNDLYLRGRRVPEYADDAVREILEAPCRIIYRVTSNEIRIRTIMHSRQSGVRAMDGAQQSPGRAQRGRADRDAPSSVQALAPPLDDEQDIAPSDSWTCQHLLTVPS